MIIAGRANSCHNSTPLARLPARALCALTSYVYSANTLSSRKSGSICNPLARAHTVVSDDTLWVSEANWKFMAARVCDLLLRWNIHAAKCAMKYDTRTDVGNICCT
jgi:hypothetical protein